MSLRIVPVALIAFALLSCGVKSDLERPMAQVIQKPQPGLPPQPVLQNPQKDPSKPPSRWASRAAPRRLTRQAREGYVNHFQYRNGILSAEDVPLTELAEAVGTPFYCYSTATLTRHYRVFAAALPKGSLIAFSVKANGNIAVLKTLGQLGAGADVVSGGELKKALAAGIPANRIVFSGVGKTREEMRLALEAGIYQFNVEGEPELEALSEVAVSMGATAPITIRVNPDVDAKTHAKITTGTYETKFGVPWPRARDTYAVAAKLPGIEVVGVDVHIGSQITELDPFRAAFGRVADLIAELRADGHRILRADLGGGLGVPYRLDNAPPPDPDAYGEVIAGGDARARRAGDPRAGPADCRQCGHPGFARDLRKTRRIQDLPGARCRDERSHKTCALRCPS